MKYIIQIVLCCIVCFAAIYVIQHQLLPGYLQNLISPTTAGNVGISYDTDLVYQRTTERTQTKEIESAHILAMQALQDTTYTIASDDSPQATAIKISNEGIVLGYAPAYSYSSGSVAQSDTRGQTAVIAHISYDNGWHIRELDIDGQSLNLPYVDLGSIGDNNPLGQSLISLDFSTGSHVGHIGYLASYASSTSTQNIIPNNKNTITWRTGGDTGPAYTPVLRSDGELLGVVGEGSSDLIYISREQLALMLDQRTGIQMQSALNDISDTQQSTLTGTGDTDNTVGDEQSNTNLQMKVSAQKYIYEREQLQGWEIVETNIASSTTGHIITSINNIDLMLDKGMYHYIPLLQGSQERLELGIRDINELRYYEINLDSNTIDLSILE